MFFFKHQQTFFLHLAQTWFHHLHHYTDEFQLTRNLKGKCSIPTCTNNNNQSLFLAEESWLYNWCTRRVVSRHRSLLLAILVDSCNPSPTRLLIWSDHDLPLGLVPWTISISGLVLFLLIFSSRVACYFWFHLERRRWFYMMFLVFVSHLEHHISKKAIRFLSSSFMTHVWA